MDLYLACTLMGSRAVAVQVAQVLLMGLQLAPCRRPARHLFQTTATNLQAVNAACTNMPVQMLAGYGTCMLQYVHHATPTSGFWRSTVSCCACAASWSCSAPASSLIIAARSITRASAAPVSATTWWGFCLLCTDLFCLILLLLLSGQQVLLASALVGHCIHEAATGIPIRTSCRTLCTW
jgi:hypothetical protein